ncbi:MAG: glycosyltransferase family 2 protein [Gammaproteobacteria bacterium]|nr:glycosyltransferase family 2 protein [Gammaproteobacteria bacterium]
MNKNPTFWFAIPVHNRVEFTRECLKSIYRQDDMGFQVVVCDDGSTDGTADMLTNEFPAVHVLTGDGNLWWTGATNACINFILNRASAKDMVITLNDDLIIADDYLVQLQRAFEQHGEIIQTSAPYDINDRERLVDSGRRMDWWLAKEVLLPKAQSGLASVTHAPGRGTIFPIAVFEKIGLFDFENLPHYAADYDFTHRARRAGYPLYINYDAKLYSHIDATGSTKYRATRSFAGLFSYLTDIKSPACLKYRWIFNKQNCPWYLLPSFTLLDTIRVIGSYYRRR